MALKQELERDIELAKMMAADIDKVYKKYAKAAIEAQQARFIKIQNEKYYGCSNADELHDLYGADEITLDEYDAGRDFFEGQDKRKAQMSLIEQHRKNLREIRDNWKGTVKELQEELDDLNGVIKEKPLDAFERLEQENRTERLAALRLQDSL